MRLQRPIPSTCSELDAAAEPSPQNVVVATLLAVHQTYASDHDLVTYVGVAAVRSTLITSPSRDPISTLITVHVAWQMDPQKCLAPETRLPQGPVHSMYYMSMGIVCVYIYVLEFSGSVLVYE
jgi:hypothetical protein